MLDRIDECGLLETSPAQSSTRPTYGLKRGELTGPSPVDRGKPGSKMHVLSDANGLPLVVGVSAANVHDSQGLKAMVAGLHTRHDPENGRCAVVRVAEFDRFPV